jgi:hypothetical protein
MRRTNRGPWTIKAFSSKAEPLREAPLNLRALSWVRCADAAFCDECGVRLAATCPNCGEANPPGAEFCRKCGEGLTQRTATARAPAATLAPPESYTSRHLAEKILTSKSALEGERKQVTVLFADNGSATSPAWPARSRAAQGRDTVASTGKKEAFRNAHPGRPKAPHS